MSLEPRGAFIPGTNEGVHAQTRRRVGELEQSIPGPADPPMFCVNATAINLGGVDVAVSPRWWPWRGAVILDWVSVDLTASDSGSVTVDLLRSDVTVLSVTAAAGYTPCPADGISWSPAQHLRIHVTGSADLLDVQLWFRGYGGGALLLAPDPGGGIG